MKKIESRLDNESILAQSLINDMISQDSKRRPTAADILKHPFFWKADRILSFLSEVSDRIEKDYPSSSYQNLFEKNRSLVFKGDWLMVIEEKIRQALTETNFRKYRGDSVKDLLRALRNMASIQFRFSTF